MAQIKAHFDGQVFVPDEPVSLRPGESVVVQSASEGVDRPAIRDASFLRKLDLALDSRSVREIADDPELSLENL